MAAEPYARQSANTTAKQPSPVHASRWLVAIVGVCGALAGASIVEAFAALFTHPNMPLAPDWLVAPPLVALGTLGGGILAAMVAGKDIPESSNATPIHLAVESAPAAPMSWQPVPMMPPNGHALNFSRVGYRSDRGRTTPIHRTVRHSRTVIHHGRIITHHAHTLRSRHPAS